MTLAVDTEKDELRQRVMEVAKRHKASWMELGQCLYSIYRDKQYRHWGFLTFEVYCRKELRIQETTAAKLLRSYYFLEQEEPEVAKAALSDEGAPKAVPSYESVNLLRLAKKNRKFTAADYSHLKEAVLDAVKEPKEVRAQVRKLLSERDTRDPAEIRKARRNAAIRRAVTVLAHLKQELGSERLLPEYLLKQITELSQKLEDQLE